MITPDDVIMALSWSGETAELKRPDRLFAALPHRPRRHHRGRREHARQGGRCGAGAAAGPRSLPAQSGADHVLAHAAGARRRAGDRAAGKPRLHRGRFRPAASRRPARRAAEVHPRHHAQRKVGPARAARHQDVGCGAGNVGQGLWLRRHHRQRRQSRRHHHRRRSPPPHARRSAQRQGRRDHDSCVRRPSGPISLSARRWNCSTP